MTCKDEWCPRCTERGARLKAQAMAVLDRNRVSLTKRVATEKDMAVLASTKE